MPGHCCPFDYKFVVCHGSRPFIGDPIYGIDHIECGSFGDVFWSASPSDSDEFDRCAGAKTSTKAVCTRGIKRNDDV